MPSMLDLKNKLREVAECFLPGDKVIYIDVPFHFNVGDLLINSGTENFFSEYGINVSHRYSTLDVPNRIPDVDEHTVLAFHGGGNLGDLASATFSWEHHQTIRERVIASHRNTRCVILPQTVYFRSLQTQEQSLKVLAQHPKLRVFARDLVSLKKLKDGGIRTAQAMPDMAHSLYGVLKHDPVPASGMMAMIRRDQESSHNEDTTSFSESIDWDDIVPPALRNLGFATRQLVRIDRLFGVPLDHTKLFYPIRDRAIQKAIATFSRFERVVTDRLHGTLLSLLLGIPVKAIDNSYGKLSTYCATWLQGCPGLECAWVEERNYADKQNSPLEAISNSRG